MKWDEMARQVADFPSGAGRCIFVALHSLEDGSCLGKCPSDGEQVTVEEIQWLNQAFKDPTMLYSSGITLRDKRFTYVKVEKNALLGRTSTQACLVMRSETGLKATPITKTRSRNKEDRAILK